jgi:hypothetical protein
VFIGMTVRVAIGAADDPAVDRSARGRRTADDVLEPDDSAEPSTSGSGTSMQLGSPRRALATATTGPEASTVGEDRLLLADEISCAWIEAPAPTSAADIAAKLANAV